MKKLLMLLPLLLAGCVHRTMPPGSYQVISIASGTNGKVDYACSQLTGTPYDRTDIVFSCQFHNHTDQIQPGPAVRIALYSEKTNKLIGVSHTIYALPTNPNQTDIKHVYLNRYNITPWCGSNLECCIVLVEKDQH
jgi:hypothetical protein